MKSLVRSVVLVAASAMSTAAATAAEMQVEGTVYYVNANRGARPAKLDNGVTIVPFNQKGIIVDSDSARSFNLAAHDCIGTLAVGEDGVATGGGYCLATDKDGDVWWLSWTSDAKTGGTWTAFLGTGKYEGITGSGTTKFVASQGDRSVISYSGTLNLK